MNVLPKPPYVDDNIWLEEETHTYYLKDDPDQTFTSATTLIHHFFEEFDGDGIAKRFVYQGTRYANLSTSDILNLWEIEGYKDEEVEEGISKGISPLVLARRMVRRAKKYSGYTEESLLKEWAQSGIDGTKTHLEIENYIISDRQTKIETVKGLHAKNWIDRVYSRDEYDWYAEVILYDREIGVAGTIDLLLIHRKTKVVYLFDWKTNKRIYKKSFGGKKGIHPLTEHLDDCNYVHYSLQLSIYQFLLEKNFGVTVGSRQILWLHPEAGVVTYNGIYHPGTASGMLHELQLHNTKKKST